MKLSEKLAVVTGGASGIGLAISQLFAHEGATVVIIDANGDMAKAASDMISARGLQSWSTAVDVRSETAISAAVESILQRGKIDLLVNSAGIAATASFLDTTSEMFDAMYAVNLRGTFLFSRAVAQSMVDFNVRGSIVHIGSVSGMRGNAGRTAYGASKAGISQLTRIMAVELAQYGIRTNAIAPGPIETPLAETGHTQSIRDEWLRELPIKRYGTAAEVAAAALFLASEDTQYINGHLLAADGGFYASGILTH